MVLGIDHIELIVRDVDEYVEFYQKMGFKLLLRTGHHGGFGRNCSCPAKTSR